MILTETQLQHLVAALENAATLLARMAPRESEAQYAVQRLRHQVRLLRASEQSMQVYRREQP